jgi:hypothetical protein
MASVVEKIPDYLEDAQISGEVLRDMSEFLSVDREGIGLYTTAPRLVFDRDVSTRLKVFRQQTRKHARILFRIAAFGMTPDM